LKNIIKISFSYHVVIFDGPCNLCNKYVDYIIRNDYADKCRFISLESDTARHFLSEHGFDLEDLTSIIVVSSGNIFIKSRAVFKVLSLMKKPVRYWSFLRYVIPRFILDFVYSIVSRNRYLLFGKSDTCRLPSESEASKFL